MCDFGGKWQSISFSIIYIFNYVQFDANKFIIWIFDCGVNSSILTARELGRIWIQYKF